MKYCDTAHWMAHSKVDPSISAAHCCLFATAFAVRILLLELITCARIKWQLIKCAALVSLVLPRRSTRELQINPRRLSCHRTISRIIFIIVDVVYTWNVAEFRPQVCVNRGDLSCVELSDFRCAQFVQVWVREIGGELKIYLQILSIWQLLIIRQ